jgi:hypothetical protein
MSGSLARQESVQLGQNDQHTGRPADTEAVIVGMQRELNGPSLWTLAGNMR